MTLQEVSLGILGAGAMGRSILKGILQSSVVSSEQVCVSDLSPETLSTIKKTCGVKTTLDNHELVRRANCILLAVKPQNMRVLLKEIQPVADGQKLFLSIAAGVSSQTIFDGLSGRGRIVRIMPNTAARVGKSASALCLGPGATQNDLQIAKELFGAVGSTSVIGEELMDAVTGLSGSGPAYLFLVIEALADAGVKAGLPRAAAVTLAAQTCLGAAGLVLETGDHPAVLKDQVTSPAGTTIAGLHVLEKEGVRNAFIAAVEAAAARSKELGKA